MKMKNNFKLYMMMFFTFSLLNAGGFTLSTTTANNGVPTRVLSGEYGQRINLLPCLSDTLDGIPCADIYISASDSSYVVHGWGFGVGPELADGVPAKFFVFLNGDAVNMQRFALGGGGGVSFASYTIFDAGSLPVGTHSILGYWTSKSYGDFIAPTTLVVMP